MNPLVNLALLHEAVVSANFRRHEIINTRNQPADILYDPVKGDYHNKNTPWGVFGYPYQYDAGYPEDPDDGFQYMIEWPIPKRINYFSCGGDYCGTSHSETPWALQYWNGKAWHTLIDGIGGGSGWDWMTGEINAPWPYTPGVDHTALSIWMVPEEEAITTKKIRLAAWSDGFTPLFSFALRCHGGITIYNDDSENPFKAVLVQYAEIVDPTTTVETSDVINPAGFALHQNYPNPFNPTTNIIFSVNKNCHVTLRVFDILGKKVASIIDQQLKAGYHEIQFNAEGLASGIYFYQIQMGEYRETKKMLLSR